MQNINYAYNNCYYMKKIFTTLLIAVAVTAQSQYLPNSGFDSWKSSCGFSEAFGTGGFTSPKTGEMRQRPGVEPNDWNGSSINQKVMMTKTQELVFNEEGAVKLQNVYVGVGSLGSVAPGFITLGTPWVYATSTIEDCDGGTYGGVAFTHKPDAITGRFKRTDSNNENSHIIVYLWNGTYKSNVGNKNNPSQERDDVDRAILKGGSTSNGTLVAQCDRAFSSTGGDWQEITVPIEYENGNNLAPEKMNVVISGGDYWTRANMQDGTTLFADDVQFVYYSELASLYYDGVSHFIKDKTEYAVDAVYDESKLSVTTNGKGATIEKSFDESSKLLTITIKGNDYAANSNNFHTYTIQFKNDEVVDPDPTPDPDPDPNPDPDPTPGDVDYTPAYTGEKTKPSRWITAVTLESGVYTEHAANTLNVDNSGNLCYNDYSGTVTMKAAAGENVTVTMGMNGSWMNAYLYIDADSDGFTASIADGSSWKPSGDLVSYSFYNNGSSSDNTGWNSVGASVLGDARSTVALPSFAVPETPGVYRVRVKLDWCNIDPAGDSDGKFGDFMDNGGQIVDFMLEVVGDDVIDPNPEPEPDPDPTPEPGDVDYTPTNTGTRDYEERNIDAIKFVSAIHGEVVYEPTATERKNEYLDLTGAELYFVAALGEQVSIELTTDGSWVNHYVYIDYDADGFTASIADGSNWQPAGDLVSYSFYNNGGSSDNSGWNSLGEAISGDNRSKPVLPLFTVPAEAGRYRMRIKQDWCSIDPMGDSDTNFGGTFFNYGGQIIDVILVVTAETGINELKGENGKVKVIYDLQGRKVENPTNGIYIVDGKKVLIK